MDSFFKCLSKNYNIPDERIIRVAYFGSYDPLYTRVRVTLKGLEKNGVEVFQCLDTKNNYFLRLLSLTTQYLKLANRVDLLMVSEAGQSYVFLARILSTLTKKPLLFDAFLSHYHVKTQDDKSVNQHSIEGKALYYLDKLSCQLADLTLLDTDEHIRYFCKEFNLSPSKFRVLPVGSDEELFYPRKSSPKKSKFLIFLVSSFYPLHGVQYVVTAAKMLEKEKDIEFIVVGNGPDKKGIENLVKNLKADNILFKDRVPPDELAEIMVEADICLGQFGKTIQAQMVVPAKLYDAIAMAKPIITGRAKSVGAIFTDDENIIFCPVGDPQCLAEKILLLKKDDELRRKISENGYRLFIERFSSVKIGAKLKLVIQDLINENCKK